MLRSAGVAVFMPDGNYKITKKIQISSSYVVLRGSSVRRCTEWALCACIAAAAHAASLSLLGPPPAPRHLPQKDSCTLTFPNALADVYGGSNNWAFGGGFLA